MTKGDIFYLIFVKGRFIFRANVGSKIENKRSLDFKSNPNAPLCLSIT